MTASAQGLAGDGEPAFAFEPSEFRPEASAMLVRNVSQVRVPNHEAIPSRLAHPVEPHEVANTVGVDSRRPAGSAQEVVALAFAEAIAWQGANALLIGQDNRRTEWVPLPAAVRSGQAYAIEPRERFLAVDVDGPADETWAAHVRHDAEMAGCRVVVVNSGRSGHHHIWLICPPGWTHAYAKRRMMAAGAPKDKLRTGSATRAPYAPHRDPSLPRAVVTEPGPATALQWFREAAPRSVPPQIRDALRHFNKETATRFGAGIGKPGKPSRGLTIKRFALAAVNAGWEFREFEAELKDPANETASKYREMSPERRRDWAHAVWEEQCEYVRDHPPIIPTKIARDQLRIFAARADRRAWLGRAGATDRAVYLSLIWAGFQGGTMTPTASIRQLSEAANVSKETARRSLQRLLKTSLIRRETPAIADKATRWRLMPPLPSDLTEESTEAHMQPETYCSEAITDPLRGERGLVMARRTSLLADVFANGSGLGIATYETWQVLTNQPLTTAEVVNRRSPGLTHRSVREHLKKLDAHGLAVRAGNLWTKREPSTPELEKIARTLGVKGKTKARKEYHRREREVQHARMALG